MPLIFQSCNFTISYHCAELSCYMVNDTLRHHINLIFYLPKANRLHFISVFEAQAHLQEHFGVTTSFFSQTRAANKTRMFKTSYSHLFGREKCKWVQCKWESPHINTKWVYLMDTKKDTDTGRVQRKRQQQKRKQKRKLHVEWKKCNLKCCLKARWQLVG